MVKHSLMPWIEKSSKSLCFPTKVVASRNPWEVFRRELIGRGFERSERQLVVWQSERLTSNPKFTRIKLNRTNKRLSRHLVISNHLWLFTNSAISCAPAIQTILSLLKKPKLLFHLTDEDCSVNNYSTRNLVKLLNLNSESYFMIQPKQRLTAFRESLESQSRRVKTQQSSCLLQFLKSTKCCVYLEGESICTLFQLK